MKKIFILLCLGITATSVSSQNSANVRPAYVPVTMNGVEQTLQAVGGFNSPMFSEADLNNDGIKDLVVFERSREIGEVLTFINAGTSGQVSYHYAPEYAANFPPCSYYMLMRDFNGDGAFDIFTVNRQQTCLNMVYKGYFDNQNRLAFRVFSNTLFYQYVSPISNGFTCENIPAIEDIDRDGDLDILMMDPSSGYWGRLFQNTSVETNGNRDSLIFRIGDDCWGRFGEQLGTLIPSSGVRSCSFLPNWRPRNNRHDAAANISIGDMDGDNDFDMVFVHTGATTVSVGINTGTSDTAYFANFTPYFPGNSMTTTPVDLKYFPHAYFIDIDNDGIKEIIVAPSNLDISKDKDNVWLYKNQGTLTQPNYQLLQENFLVGLMADNGSYAHPRFFDLDYDGLLDLFVGTNGSVDTEHLLGGLAYYKNVGTSTAPRFQYIAENLINIRDSLAQNSWETRYCPAFRERFGIFDIILRYNSLFNQSASRYIPTFQVAWFYDGCAEGDSPFMFEMTNDGIPDMVTGDATGKLMVLPSDNSLMRQCRYSSRITNIGNVDVSPNRSGVNGHSVPVLKTINNQTYLWVGSYAGDIHQYTNIFLPNGTLNPTFTMVTPTFGGIKFGKYSSMDVADINNDGAMDYVVGNLRGGFTFYSEGNLTGVEEVIATAHAQVATLYPNPSSGTLTISLTESTAPDDAKAKVMDLWGRTIAEYPFSGSLQKQLDLSHLPSGMYLIEVSTPTAAQTLKWVKVE